MTEVYQGMKHRNGTGGITSDSSLSDNNSHSDPLSLKERFAEQTTLHGVGFWLNPKKSRGSRVLYFVIWFMMVAFVVINLYKNINRFLQYQTRVSFSSDKEETLMFPSITICPENPYPKSKVGGSKLKLEATKGMHPDYPLMEACYDPTLHDHFPDVNHTLAFMSKVSVKKAIEWVVFGLEQVFKKCSWKMSKIDCSELFIGHLTSMPRCYTFNYAGKYSTNDDSVFWIFSEKIKVYVFS